MRHRLVSFLLVALAFLFLLPPMEFSFIHHEVWSGGVFMVSGKTGVQFSSPGWAVYNLTCNGKMGRVVVRDDFTGKVLLNASVFGHGQFVVTLPHAGDYSVQAGARNTSLTCVGQVWEPYPTRRVQSISYVGSSVFLFLFALALWRWWR